MGGSQSAPVVKTESVDIRETDPRTGTYANGLSMAPGSSEECDGCNIKIDPGISSSAVSITRDSVDTGRSSRLVIIPSIPFRMQYTDAATTEPLEDKITRIEVYYPSPLRVENVQHDACIAFIGVGSDSHVFVPLVAGPNAKTKFISKLTPFLAPMTTGTGQKVSSDGKLIDGPYFNSATGKFGKIDVPSGNDWSLSDIFSGNDSFFTWTPKGLKLSEPMVIDAKSSPTDAINTNLLNLVPEASKAKIFDYRGFNYFPKANTKYNFYRWDDDTNIKSRYIFMQNPITISASDLMTIQQLPITMPETVDMKLSKVYHKAGAPAPGSCSPQPPLSLPKLPLILQSVSGGGTGPLSSYSLTTIVIATISAVVGFVAIYMGVKWAMTNYGDLFKNLGIRFGKLFAGRVAGMDNFIEPSHSQVRDLFKKVNKRSTTLPSTTNLLSSITPPAELPSFRKLDIAPHTKIEGMAPPGEHLGEQIDKLQEESPVNIEPSPSPSPRPILKRTSRRKFRQPFLDAQARLETLRNRRK
jgi:hypothetical protein